MKDIPNPATRTIPNSSQKGIIILNEGAYGNNNADISFLEYKTQTVSNSIFKTANNKSLGDVAQDILYHQGKFYISLNNSNKIVVLDAINFTEIKTISSVSYPRYFLPINDSVVYVSSLYTPIIYVINTKHNTVVTSVALDFPNVEKMLLFNGKVYATNWNIQCKHIYEINPETHTILNRIPIAGFASHEIGVDKNGLLWVLSGNKYQNINSFFSVINPISKQLVRSVSFEKEQDPFRLVFSHNKDSLYFLQVNYQGKNTHNGLYKMAITDSFVPKTAFIEAQINSYFWAIGLDTVNNNIYLSDPKGFNQSSSIFQYDINGNFIQTFKAGIGANTFLF